MRPPERLAAGLIHGAAEMLPVSSSGHAALVGGGGADPVGLHAGSLAAVVLACRDEAAEVLRRLDRRRVAMHLLAGVVPSAAGLALERRGGGHAGGAPAPWHVRPRRVALARAMLAGAALLACGDLRRGERSRWDAGPADGLWLGLAQAAALRPGVSRNGATLAVARLRGFAPSEANPLAREVGVPVTLGAVALRRARPGAETAASFAGALAAVPLMRIVDRGGPLWPWAAERALLALVLLRQSRAA